MISKTTKVNKRKTSISIAEINFSLPRGTPLIPFDRLRRPIFIPSDPRRAVYFFQPHAKWSCRYLKEKKKNHRAKRVNKNMNSTRYVAGQPGRRPIRVHAYRSLQFHRPFPSNFKSFRILRHAPRRIALRLPFCRAHNEIKRRSEFEQARDPPSWGTSGIYFKSDAKGGYWKVNSRFHRCFGNYWRRE